MSLTELLARVKVKDIYSQVRKQPSLKLSSLIILAFDLFLNFTI